MTNELRSNATKKVNELLEHKLYTKIKLSSILDVSLRTIYNRLNDEQWTGEQIKIINDL